MTLQLGDSALTHFPLAEKCLPTKEYLGMQHACTNKCLPLQEHLDVCFCPGISTNPKCSTVEYMNSQMLKTMWATSEPSITSLCSNSHGSSLLVWRLQLHGQFPDVQTLGTHRLILKTRMLEAWVLLSKRAAVKGHHWDSSDVCGTVYINLQCLSFWQFIPQIWSLLGTLSTPINSASWPGGLAHLLQADTAWYNTGCLTFS